MHAPQVPAVVHSAHRPDKGLCAVAVPLARWIGLILFVVFCALAFQLRQRDLEFPIESDFVWQTTEEWRNFFASFNPHILSTPKINVYLDGQFIVYGLLDGALRWFKFLRPAFPNDSSFVLGAALLANGVAYAAASTILFATVFRLTGSVVIATAIAFGFFLAPQMLNINLARVDYLITLPISAIFYCSCVLTMGHERKRHAIALGAAVAFAATLKISGLFLGVIPACAALAVFNPRKTRQIAAFTIISLAAFAIAYFILMGRFFYYLRPVDIVRFYLNTIESVRPWTALEDQPPFYYNIELMMGHGVAFVVLYLLCAVATIVHALLRRSRTSIFLGLCFVALSAGGMMEPLKYGRGGYHMLPVFFSVVGFIAAEILHSSLNRIAKTAVLAIGALIFVTSIVKSVPVYADVVAKRRAEAIAIQAIKREPREWLLAHFPPGARLCVQTHSTWTLPDLGGFVPTDGPIALPYLDPIALARTAPPSIDALKKSCSALVTSDFHRLLFNNLLVSSSPENAAKWQKFFAEINEKFPPVVFSSPVAIYAKEIYINDLNRR
jgi:hypothetical protein